MSISGTVAASSAQFKYGTHSAYFNGASFIDMGVNAAYQPSGDFTVEAWVNPTAAPAVVAFLITKATSTGYNPYSISFLPSKVFRAQFSTSTPTQYELVGTTVATLGTWYHVALTKAGNVYTLWVNGVAEATLAQAGSSYSASTPLVIGAPSDASYPFNGHLDDFRLTIGAARYTSTFTPPGEHPWLSVFSNRGLPTPIARRVCAPARALAAGGTLNKTFDDKLSRRNTYFGGTGQIVGTVKEKNLPVNVPLHRRVCLLEEKTRLLVAETWSDAITGNYLFERIDPTRKYTVLAYDHTGLYRAVIADAQVPEVMP